MSKMLGRALGSVVSPIVEYVDVDGVIQRINIDEVLQRVDVDALLDNVDLNRHLDRVDLNRLLQRVDMDALLAQVDIQELVNRSDLPAIITQSSAGVFSSLLDAFRIQFACLDQVLHALLTCQCRCCGGFYKAMPPAPGDVVEPQPWPKKTSQKGITLQGRYAGVASRTLSWFVDELFVLVVFAIAILVVEAVWGWFADDDYDVQRDSMLFAWLFYGWNVLYYLVNIAMTGRTIGHGIFGLLVIGNNGKRIRPLQAIFLSLLMPITIVTLFGMVTSFCRRDRRMFHDMVTCTAHVYSWDARAASLRERDLSPQERITPLLESTVSRGDVEMPPV